MRGRSKTRLFLLLMVAVVILAKPAAAQSPGRIVLEATVWPDGWATIPLPPGYHIVDIDYHIPQDWAGGAARPLLYATLPDPLLWEKLAKTPVTPPPGLNKPEPRVAAGFFAAASVPGRPGDRVRIVAEPAATGQRKLMVIVIPDNNPVAKEYAEKIAALHPGLETRIYTLSQVAREFPEAPKPPGICMPGKDNAPDYNLSAALHIVGMERQLLGEGLHYLLLIGGAKEVPPLYYCSPILSELVSPEEGKVPSDYYYMDPNYDGAAEVAVGRIPFSDPLGLAGYYSALRKWIQGGDWQHYAFVSGGAPFASTLFVGEAAAGEAAKLLESMNVSVDSFLLDRGNYRGLRLSGYLGRYGIYYIMAHGSGTSLMDYIPGGLWNYDFQELLYRSEVSGLGNPGLYVLPACRDGYWDTDLTTPPFKPPSLGVELLRKGAAVGYVGFARVAIEVIDGVAATAGRVSLSMAGADRLLLAFVKALATSTTIGDAYASAVTAYNTLPASQYRVYLTRGEETVGELVTRSATLLGDPAAPAPWSSHGAPSSAPGMEAEGATPLEATVIAPTLARYAAGTVLAINPGATGKVVVTLSGTCPDEVHAYALRRVTGTTLIGMEELNTSTVQAGDKCRLLIDAAGSTASTVRILAFWNNTPTAYYLVLAGAYIDTQRGVLVLRGLDSLGVIGDEPMLLQVDNVTVATIEGGKPEAVIPLRLIAQRLGRGGAASITLRPLYDTAAIYGGPLVATQVDKLLKLFTVNATLEQTLPLAGETAYAAGIAPEPAKELGRVAGSKAYAAVASAAAGIALLGAAWLASGRLCGRNR